MPPARTVRGYGFGERLKDLSKTRGGPENIGKVLAYTDDDTQPPLQIEVPNVRKFVLRVTQTLESLKWVRIEVYNTKKPNPELILNHTRCPDDDGGAATELEDISGNSALTDHGKVSLMMNACASIIFKAQDIALTRHENSQKHLMDGYKDLVSGAMKQHAITDERNTELQRVNHKLTEELVKTKVAQLAAGSDGAPGSESGKVLDEILPDLIRAGLEHFTRQGPKSAPSGGSNGSNGHAKKAAGS